MPLDIQWLGMTAGGVEHVVHELRRPTNTELLPTRMAALDAGREKVRDVVWSAEWYIAAFTEGGARNHLDLGGRGAKTPGSRKGGIVSTWISNGGY